MDRFQIQQAFNKLATENKELQSQVNLYHNLILTILFSYPDKKVVCPASEFEQIKTDAHGWGLQMHKDPEDGAIHVEAKPPVDPNEKDSPRIILP